jgi:hypothetical protein
MQSLLNAAKLSGFKIYDENEYRRILSYQLQHGQFEFIEYEDKTIGFFGWLTKIDHEGLGIFINNMFVLPQYKKNFSIFDMCKFFKNKYPNAYKLEWHNQKKDEFKKLILKGHTI